MAKEPFAEKLSSIWIGAAFFWIIKGFKSSYKEQLKPEYKNRNLWMGYVLSLLVFTAIVYFFIIK